MAHRSSMHNSIRVGSLSFNILLAFIFIFSLSLPPCFYLHHLSNCPRVLFSWSSLFCLSLHTPASCFLKLLAVSPCFPKSLSHLPIMYTSVSYPFTHMSLAHHTSVHFSFVTVISGYVLKTDNEVIAVMCEFSGRILKVLKVHEKSKCIVWNEIQTGFSLKADCCS